MDRYAYLEISSLSWKRAGNVGGAAGRGRWQRCPRSHVGCREEGARRRRRDGRKDGECVYRKRKLLVLASRSLRFCRYGKEVTRPTHRHIFGYRLRSKGEEFTKIPLAKAEVIRCRLILAVEHRIFVLYRPLERVVGSRVSIPLEAGL
jgi:hypothetical protein